MILLAAAVVAVSLFRFARLSSILGYVAAGLVIGPWGLNLIGDIGRITHVSEFGIVLLLFIIGLELQPTRLWVMRRLVFGLGAAQVLSCTLLLGAAGVGSGAATGGRGRDRFRAVAVLDSAGAAGAGRARRSCKTQHGRSGLRHPAVPGPGGAAGARGAAAAVAAGRRAPRRRRRGWRWSSSWSWWPSVIVGGRLLLRPALRLVARVARQRGVHRGRAPDRDRHGAARQPRRAVRCRSARSSPACCSPTRSSATSSKPTSSPSRGCCSGCSSCASAWRRTSACCSPSR